MSEPPPGEGLALLRARAATLPAALAEAFAGADPAPDLSGAEVGSIVTTGIGSSAAHARYLAHLLSHDLGLPARFSAPGVHVVAPPTRARDELLVVFSQGLSPNARFALSHARAWRRVVLVTATPEDGGSRPDAEEKRRLLARLADAGACIIRTPGVDEYGTLLRVVGPLVGYAAALRLARALAPRGAALPAALAASPHEIRAALDASIHRAAEIAREAELPAPDEALAFVALGVTAEISGNLPLKVLEGWRRPAPPVWDLLHLTHGPWQELAPRRAVLLALAHSGAAAEGEVLAHAESLLEAGRHRLVRLDATLPAPLSIFEHEMLVNALVLRGIEAGGPDPARFAGSDGESALYALAPAPAATASRTLDVPPARALAALTSPELDSLLSRGIRTAVVPLGALEQHGPHLPLDTDTRIADALAERFCAAVPEAVRLPALFAGVSREHMGFPGTLDLRPGTLEALLLDLLDSLARHGFEHVVVFSAHGGNVATLRKIEPVLRAATAPARLVLVHDLESLAAAQARASAAAGVAPEAAGHHAGEHETSILLGLAPEQVRKARLAPGRLVPVAGAQSLFYPSLRASAPSGVLGDPRCADGARAESYLAAWTARLVSAYRAEKNVSVAKGTKNA